MDWSSMPQHLAIHNHLLLKNKLPRKDKMNSSNTNKYVLKCYLNVFTIVSDEMRGFKVSYA